MLADYAYLGESAISDYENALTLKEEDFPDRRLVCHLYSQSAQSALNAMLVHVHGPIEPDSINLLSLLKTLRLLDPNVPECLLQPSARNAARLLSRTLLLNRSLSGRDFVLRDLFDRTAVSDCHHAANLFVEAMTSHLLMLTLDQLEQRFHQHRRPPMTDIEFWRRCRIRIAHASVDEPDLQND